MKSKSASSAAASLAANTSNQLPPVNPIGVNLRIQIIKARNLTAKDRNGKSDPFVVTSLPGSNPPAISSTPTSTFTSISNNSISSPNSSSNSNNNPDPQSHATWKKQTPVVPKRLDPEWKTEETTYDLPILQNWLAADELVYVLENRRLELARKAQLEGHDAIESDQEGNGEAEVAASESVPALSSRAGAGQGNAPAPSPSSLSSSNETSNSNQVSHQEKDVVAHDTATRPTMTTRHSSRLSYLSSSSKKLLSAPVRLIKVPARMSMSRNSSSNQVSLALSDQSPSSADPTSSNASRGRRRAPRPMTIRRRRRNQSQAQQQSKESERANPSAQGSLGNVEFVLWDHDRFSGNDYLGEVSLDISKWSLDGEGVSARWEDSKPIWLPLVSSRSSEKVSGELQVRIGLVASGDASSSSSTMDLDEVYQRLVLASSHPLHLDSLGDLAPSDEDADFNGEIEDGHGEDQARLEVRHIPASESVGTSGPAEAFLDDGLSSGDSASEDGNSSDDEADLTATEGEDTDLEDADIYDEHYKSIAEVPPATASATSNKLPNVDAMSPVSSHALESDQGKAPSTTASPSNVAQRRKVFGRKSATSSGLTTQSSSSGSLDPSSQSKKKRLGRKKKVAIDPQTGEAALPTKRIKRKKSTKRKDFSFKAEMGKDIIGIVMMEVKGAKDLPKWMNMTHTSFDMDPFTIVSFGQKIFRTKVARHTLNPTWDEKLLFHVRRHETHFQAKFAIYDWDKMSSNDHVGSASICIKELIEAAPKPDPQTGLYAADEDTDSQKMKSFTLQLEKRENDDDHKYGSFQPTLTVEAKFTPYDALRQRLWRQVLKQYDTNDSETISTLEMTSMLDSLGSTLSTRTLHSWWEAVGKKPDEDELTFDESIAALEREIQKPWSEKRYVDASSDALESGLQTPGESGAVANSSSSSGLDLVGQQAPVKKEADISADKNVVAPSALSDSESATQKEKSFAESAAALSLSSEERGTAQVPTRGREGSSSSDASLSLLNDYGRGSSSVERVIRLKSCPLCHLPRLNSKAEVDIVTHLAVCASHDWRRVDSMTSGVSNFVTASQAQRKWYTKVVTKISQGSYQLGADSANIIVQDRISGELLEEKMQVYVRLGIRLLYRGAKSRMEGNRVKKMLKNMSVKQGAKFDNPSSVRDIAPFINFHQLNMEEVLDPIDSFKNFNEFFYRKLKPDARPNDDPDDPTTLVSGADCRMMAFESVEAATKVWIKGKEFSIERLLGDDYKGKLDKYKGGSLCIFRLAPQDYHRFHVPVDATIGEIKRIDGQYYTVNPMAVRSSIDIYGENIRSVVPFHSKEFGTVYQVCVGAMMVGSTVFTAKSHQQVKRGDELGYYKFGGSTNILLFEKGRNQFDQDLLDNSSRAIETLVRVGIRVGKALKPDAGVTTP